MVERESLTVERLETDAASLTLSREAAAARTELAQLEDSSKASREAIAAQWKLLEEERARIATLLENDRQAYAGALHKERESAAAAFAAAEASHAEGAAAMRQQLVEAAAATDKALVKASTAQASTMAHERELAELRVSLSSSQKQQEATVVALSEAVSVAPLPN